MIQKYTCVPVAEYDVLIITNGTVAQVEDALEVLNEQTNEVPFTSNVVYLDSFKDLIQHLDMNEKMDLLTRSICFKGKVVFMFFNGLEYIQTFLCEIIDHYNALMQNLASNTASFKYQQLYNVYFYFGASVAQDSGLDAHLSIFQDSHQFNTIVSIANDILKKIDFMVYRIRGVYLDDGQLSGERVYPLHSLLRNFPNVERVELTSSPPFLMKGLIV